MTERIGEELFNELYADTLSDCPSDFEINCNDSESDESDIIPRKRQKRNVIESDSESENDTFFGGLFKHFGCNCGIK